MKILAQTSIPSLKPSKSDRLLDWTGIIFHQNQFCFPGPLAAAGLALVILGWPCGKPSSFAGEKEKIVPAVKKIGATRYRLGAVEFDARTRQIFIPVVVNKREGGPMEYILVHETGKVHESIFATKASPLNIQIILKLLKYHSGEGDVFDSLLPESERNRKKEKSEVRGDSTEVLILMEGETEPHVVSETILDAETSKPMTEEGWIYTGSEVDKGHFMAQIEGSIIAVYLDKLAMFNMAREGADNDERWGANPDSISEIGKRGTLILQPSNHAK